MSPEQIVDLRQRVLRSEPVTDDELRHALSSLALARATVSGARAKSASGDTVYAPKGALSDRFAAFKSAKQHTDVAGQPQLPGVEPVKVS